ncbi:MAG TPA: GntR family transcriptional regulator [Ideonella sp.]|nr:GntR family transcriptional regulator [Ideonella sp.]
MSKLRYGHIARELTEGIAAGRFPVGSLLPTELELCEQYGTSRHTVRAALHELQELGLVSRRKNVGTRVEAAKPSGAYRQSLASVEDLAQFGEAHVRTVRSVEEIVADLVLAKELGCPGGTRWLRISSLRMVDGAAGLPMGWTDIYIPPTYAEIGELVRDSPEKLVSTLIEARYGRRIAQIRQDIQAVSVPAALAGELQVAAGSAALKIVRRYFDTSREAFEITVTLHPAERFTYSVQLHRAREAGD